VEAARVTVLGLAVLAGAIAAAGVFVARNVDRIVGERPAGALVLVAMTPLIPFIGIGFGVSLDDVLPVLGFGMAGVHLARERALPVPAPRWTVWLALAAAGLLFVAAAISSVANGEGLVSGLRLFVRGAGHMLLVFGIGAVAAISIARRPRLREVVCLALAGVGTFEALFGLAAYVGVLPGQIGLQAMGRGSALFGDVPGRVTGTTAIAANYAGAVLLITVLVTAGLALAAVTRRDRAIGWASVAVQMVALGLTFSRAPLALAVAGLVALIVLRSRAILLVPMVLAVIVAVLLSPLRERFLEDSTNRLALWWSAFLIMIDHPLTGSGPGLSRVVARANPERYVFTDLGRAPATAHNAILHGGAEMGVLGLLGFLLTYVLLAAVGLLAALRAVRAGDTLLLALALALGGFLAQGMVNNLMTVGMTSVLGGLLAGTVASGLLSDAPAPVPAGSPLAGRRADAGRTALHSRP
jgi:hypothetical protein